MNPTEYFIAELSKLLEKHETETGTYIEFIRINRVPMQKIDNEIRAERPIQDIELELK